MYLNDHGKERLHVITEIRSILSSLLKNPTQSHMDQVVPSYTESENLRNNWSRKKGYETIDARTDGEGLNRLRISIISQVEVHTESLRLVGWVSVWGLGEEILESLSPGDKTTGLTSSGPGPVDPCRGPR